MSEMIREIMNVDQNIIQTIETKRLIWYGHQNGWKKTGGPIKFGSGHCQSTEKGEEAGEKKCKMRWKQDD